MTFSAPAILTHTVNFDVTAHNVKTVKAIAGVSEFVAVVKADGHSQGVLQIARATLDGGTTQLGVVTIDEALSVRKEFHTTLDGGHAIPILAWTWDAAATSLVQRAIVASVDLGLSPIAHALAVANAGQALPVTPHVMVMVDTGLGHSGSSMANGDFEHTVAQPVELHKTGVLNITGAFTHFACVGGPGNKSVDKQAQNFRAAIAVLREAGLDELINHTANSPTSLSRPDLTSDMVCLGLTIYGGEPIVGSTHGLRPATRWEASVTLVRKLPAGQSVPYRQTWTADRDTIIGAVPCDYADGVMRSASGRFEVNINGTRHPQVGRVRMDRSVVDLGPDTDVEVGDTAVIADDPTLGEPGFDDLVKVFGTINYEILIAPKGRSERKWVRGRVAPTAEDMHDLGEEIGRELAVGDLVILDGPFGADKTILTQGITRGMDVRGRVTSPTFTIAREYHPLATGGVTLIHVNAYRLFGEEGPGSDGEAFDALDSLDLDTDLEDSVAVAEWGMGLAGMLSERYLQVSIDCSRDGDARVITWKWSKQLQVGSSRLLSMNTLAVDTSTPQVTVGIVHSGETVAEKLHLDARTHSEVLVPLIQQCLTDSGVVVTELDVMVVGYGPGPSTGLYVGMATAASLAGVLRIPCYGIHNLDVLVGGVGDELVVTGVRRREVYFAAYRDGQRVFGSAVVKPVGVMELLKEELAAEVADFAPSHARDSLSHIEQIAGLEVTVERVSPILTAMVETACFDSAPGPLVPPYLRRPDTVVPKVMR